MKTLHDMPVWAPTPEQLRAIDKRVRAERAKAFRGAVTYVTRKVHPPTNASRARLDDLNIGFSDQKRSKNGSAP